MPTLNQLADRVANMVNQPFNHELRMRVIDMFKSGFANRIRQSTERHGIDNILTLSYIAIVDKLNYEEVYGYDDPTNELLHKEDIIGTVDKVPVPMRIHNDSPFIFVGDRKGNAFTYISNSIEHKFRENLFPTRNTIDYQLLNNHIILYIPPIDRSYDQTTINKNPINEIIITSIWENPEEVLAFYRNEDGLDIVVPFPNDLIESIMADILRVEFNIYPQDLSVQINSKVPVSND